MQYRQRLRGKNLTLHSLEIRDLWLFGREQGFSAQFAHYAGKLGAGVLEFTGIGQFRFQFAEAGLVVRIAGLEIGNAVEDLFACPALVISIQFLQVAARIDQVVPKSVVIRCSILIRGDFANVAIG